MSKDSQRKPCKFHNPLLQARASLLQGTTDQMWLVSHQDLGELNQLNTKGSTFRGKVRRNDCRVRSTEPSHLSSGLERTGLPVKGGRWQWRLCVPATTFQGRSLLFLHSAFKTQPAGVSAQSQGNSVAPSLDSLPNLRNHPTDFNCSRYLGDVPGKISHTADFSSASHTLEQWRMKKSVFYKLCFSASFSTWVRLAWSFSYC